MTGSKSPAAPSSGSGACKTSSATTPCIVCWPNDYSKEISKATYGRYCKKYKSTGTEFTTSELVTKFIGKIIVPAKSRNVITVEIRFKVSPQAGVSSANMSAAKTKLENGVNTHWNGKFTLDAIDSNTTCGKKSFSVNYKIVWVTSDEHWILKVYDSYPREGAGGGVMSVQKTTSAWIYAHEFGHVVGLPDEYSSRGGTEKVKYIKPDGSLDIDIAAPDFKPTTASDATIMSSYNNTKTLLRHCWNVAIEVQELLTSKIGRSIKCSIR